MGGLNLKRYHEDLAVLPDGERGEKIRRAKPSTVRRALSAEAPSDLVLMFAHRVGEVTPDLELIEHGRVRELQREFGEAEALYRRALDEGNPYAALRLADTLGQQGRMEEAVPYYRKAVENGHTLAHLRQIASGHLERGEFGDALTVFSLIWKAGIHDAEEAIAVVITKWIEATKQNEDPGLALAHLIKVLTWEVNEGNSFVALVLGGITEGLDMEASLAAEYYSRALGSDHDLEARRALAELFFGQQDFEQAIPHLRVLAQAGDKQALFSLGVALWFSGKPEHLDEANRVINEALTHGDWRMVWALTLGEGLGLKRVEELFRHGLSHGYNEMLVGLAYLANKRGDTRTQKRLLRQAKEAGVDVEALQRQLQAVEAVMSDLEAPKGTA